MGFLAEQPPEFPMALASFSCTAMLCKYLQLDSSLIFPGCSTHYALPEVLSCFYRLHAQQPGQDVLQVLHSHLLQHLARTWEQMQTPTTTIMDFHLALRSTYTHLHRVLSMTPRPWQLPTIATSIRHDSAEHSIEPWEQIGTFGVCTSLALTMLWMMAARLTCRGGYTAI